MDWLRWYHGTVTDPKWLVVARVSETHVTLVIVTWATMLESASKNEDERGVLSGWVAEDIAALLQAETFEIEAIYQAMQGRVLDGNRLISWMKRNPKREREDNSTERVQRYRAKQNSGSKLSVTPRNTSNATKHLEKRRIDKKREEKKGKEQGDSPGAEKRAGRIDPAADLFADAYLIQAGNPYGWLGGDFPQLMKLRSRLKIGTAETPQGWQDALANYFASPFAEFTLQHFASKFDTFKNSPLDRFKTPINHANSGVHGNGNGKSKDEINRQNAQRVLSRLDSQTRGGNERDAERSDADGVSGAATKPGVA